MIRCVPFEVIALGVGDTFSERHHTTSLLLSCDGALLAVDTPDTYRAVLREAAERCGRPLDLAAIDDVLITHVHGDHMNGLEGVAYWKFFAEGKRLRLWTSPEVREVIWDQRLVASMGTLWDGARFRQMRFDDYFDWRPLGWDGETAIGPFRLRARRTRHHVPTSAVLVEAGGRRLGYSADTAFDPELIGFLAAGDLVVHETNLGPAHTPYAELAALPADLRARMRLIHYPDTLDLAASVIAPMRQGEIVTV